MNHQQAGRRAISDLGSQKYDRPTKSAPQKGSIRVLPNEMSFKKFIDRQVNVYHFLQIRPVNHGLAFDKTTKVFDIDRQFDADGVKKRQG